MLGILAKEQRGFGQAPLPEPGPGEVRIGVAFVGICGPDLHDHHDGGIEGGPDASQRP